MTIFADCLAAVCTHSLVAPGRSLSWAIIANPKAGGFTIAKRWKQHLADLDKARSRSLANPAREDASPARILGTLVPPDSEAASLAARGLIATTGPGHAAELANALAEGLEARCEAASAMAKPLPFLVIITAGGDGTSLEVLSSFYHAPQALREHFAILRLPMGTGNDGADAPTLAGALALLAGPARVMRQRALRLLTSTAGKGPFLAFNILSVGLDAFVTHMTNKMKGRLPGDSYKLWVDIASLLYDRLYKVGPMDVKVRPADGKAPDELRQKVLLLAVGESGHRTYGSHKKILPDDRNVCLVRQMPLLRKVRLKGLFTTGEHVRTPECLFFNASRVEFTGSFPILAQMDGETVLLDPADFPAAIELTPPVIPILKKA